MIQSMLQDFKEVISCYLRPVSLYTDLPQQPGWMVADVEKYCRYAIVHLSLCLYQVLTRPPVRNEYYGKRRLS